MVVKVSPENFDKYFEELSELDSAYFPFPWQKKQWGEIDIESDYSLFVHLIDQKLVGFILYDARQEQGHLLKILIQPNQRRAGIARLLFEESCNQAGFSSVFLEVATNNHGAIEFYKSLGFEILAERRNFYSSGQNAYAMLLQCD